MRLAALTRATGGEGRGHLELEAGAGVSPAVGIITSRSQTCFPEAKPLFVAVIFNASICLPSPSFSAENVGCSDNFGMYFAFGAHWKWTS